MTYKKMKLKEKLIEEHKNNELQKKISYEAKSIKRFFKKLTLN